MSVWKFQGTVDADGRPDRYIPGVPARDLTEEDFATLGAVERLMVEVGDLYKRVGARREGAPVSETKEGSDANNG